MRPLIYSWFLSFVLSSVSRFTSHNSYEKLAAISSICRAGDTSYLLELLETEEIEASWLYGRSPCPLYEACRHGHLDIVLYLADHVPPSRVYLEKTFLSCFETACAAGHFKMTEYILAKHSATIPMHSAESAFLLSASSGHMLILNQILDRFKISSRVALIAVRECARKGHAESIVIITDSLQLNPGAFRSDILVTACKFGHISVLETSLTHFEAKPSINGNKAIYTACSYGHVHIVQRLLQDSRVSEGFDAKSCITYALNNDQPEVVSMFLADSSATSNFVNRLFQKACLRCKIQCMSVLLSDPRVDPKRLEDIIQADEVDPLVLDALLVDRRFDPTSDNNRLLKDACDFKALAVISALIRDGRADPAFDNFRLLRYLCKLDCMESYWILRRLLHDRRIDHGMTSALSSAINKRNNAKAALLLAHSSADFINLDETPFSRFACACKFNRLSEEIDSFSSLPFEWLEFATRCSASHGYNKALSFALPEMVDEWRLVYDEEDRHQRAEFMLDTIDYAISWSLRDNDLQRLLLIGLDMLSIKEFSDLALGFPAVHSLGHLCSAFFMFLQALKQDGLQDIGLQILNLLVYLYRQRFSKVY